MNLKEKVEIKSSEADKQIDHERRRLEFHTPDKIAHDWAEMVELGYKFPLSTGFPSFDEVLENSLRCKVGAHIGYGGTKKSLAVAQQSFINSESYNSTCFISSMEMAKELLFERQINFAFDHYESGDGSVRYSASKFWKEQIRSVGAKKVAEHIQEGMKKFYGDKIRVSDTARMTVDEYDKMIEMYKAEGLKIDMLAVDGLSRMGGPDSGETARYSYNVGELKDLANTHKIYIPLICHCSKGATKHTRNIAQYVRGSEKIIDDCDFQMMFSLCQNPENPDLYRNDYGWIRLYDKRGSGITKDIVYAFDNMRLKMVESNQEPSTFELQSDDKPSWL